MNIAQIRTYAAPNKDFPQGDSVELSFMPTDAEHAEFEGNKFSCEGWDIFVPTGGRLEIGPFEPYSWSRGEEESDMEMVRRGKKG